MTIGKEKNTAISPVVGVVLVVGITVVIGAGIGFTILELGQSNTETETSDIGVEVTESGQQIQFRVITGEADELKIVENGEVLSDEVLTDVSAGDEIQVPTPERGTEFTVVATYGTEDVIVTTTRTLANPIAGFAIVGDEEEGEEEPTIPVSVN